VDPLALIGIAVAHNVLADRLGRLARDSAATRDHLAAAPGCNRALWGARLDRLRVRRSAVLCELRALRAGARDAMGATA
jgi:hypothetical protein